MKAVNARTSRRAFFVKGTATLGAGVAAATGAAAVTPGGAVRAEGEDREAIRRLHQAFIAGAEGQSREAKFPTHYGYRSNALQERDSLVFSGDGHQATAVWHVDVKVGSRLEGDSTIEQMARLQGMLADVRWQTGRLHARYAKDHGRWRITALEYVTA
jgi:hypothetical protein